MTWSFDITETSPGVYQCIGFRDSGQRVMTRCKEEDIAAIYRQAFDVECRQNSFAGRALYTVISGAKPGWTAAYLKDDAGSWMIENPDGPGRFVYDGRAFQLMIFGTGEEPLWQRPVKEYDDVPDTVFGFLSEF